MTNEEYYRSGAKEYKATIDDLAERIDGLRAKMKGASPSELVSLENRIGLLCAMRRSNMDVYDILFKRAIEERKRALR